MDGQAVSMPRTYQGKPASLTDTRWLRWTMYALMAFPLIDFGLRLHGIHPLGVIWDKVVLLILVCVSVFRYITGFRPHKFAWYKFAGWFMLLGLGIMFSGFANPMVSIQGYRIDVYYMLYAFVIPFVVRREDVPKLLHIGATVAILVAVHGIYQYIVKAPMPTGWTSTSESVRTRVYSILQSPNELGAYMALMTPMIVGLTLYTRQRRLKWMYGCGAVLCAITLMLTLTRGAWVSLVLSMFVMAILFKRRLLIALIVVCVVGYFLPPIHHRIQDLLSPVYWLKSTTEGGRISKWLTAFDKMSSNPLFGVGVGNYGGAVASIYRNGAYSDNYYAKTLGETGIVGLSLFLALHIALVRDLFKHSAKRVSGRSKFIVMGGLTGLIAVLIHNSMENVFEFAPMAASYFTYAALLLVWGIGEEKEEFHEAA